MSKAQPNGGLSGKLFGKWTDLEVSNQLFVRLLVLALQIAHEAAAFRHFFDKTTAGGKVLLVVAKVLGELLNLLGEDRDLDLRRPCVRVMSLVLINELLLLVLVEHRIVISSDGPRRRCSAGVRGQQWFELRAYPSGKVGVCQSQWALSHLAMSSIASSFVATASMKARPSLVETTRRFPLRARNTFVAMKAVRLFPSEKA